MIEESNLPAWVVVMFPSDISLGGPFFSSFRLGDCVLSLAVSFSTHHQKKKTSCVSDRRRQMQEALKKRKKTVDDDAQ